MSTHSSAPTFKHNEELRYWLALLRAPGIGCSTFLALLEPFGSPREVFAAANGNFLRNSGIISEKSLNYLRNPDWDSVDKDVFWLSQKNNGALTISDASYPRLLREIHDPPPVLFYHGDPQLLHYPQLAIVGSRNPSRSGEETAYEFSKHLSNTGFVITSGLALGIDAAAHRGALAGRNLTVAVAGTGLDRVYPASHRELAHDIAQQGVMVSEFVPGTGPMAGNFPRRNRIISGLSVGTLVVEAAKQSGSLITARLAMEQSREVFAIPGSIHNPLARGCHALIRQGVKLVETASDIMEELTPLMRLMYTNLDVKTSSVPTSSQHPPEASVVFQKNQELIDSLSTEQQQLYAYMGYEPISIDTLVERSQLTTEAVSAMLVELELKGCVTSDSGMYSRTH